MRKYKDDKWRQRRRPNATEIVTVCSGRALTALYKICVGQLLATFVPTCRGFPVPHAEVSMTSGSFIAVYERSLMAPTNCNTNKPGSWRRKLWRRADGVMTPASLLCHSLPSVCRSCRMVDRWHSLSVANGSFSRSALMISLSAASYFQVRLIHWLWMNTNDARLKSHHHHHHFFNKTVVKTQPRQWMNN